jgi:hypothetical protein
MLLIFILYLTVIFAYPIYEVNINFINLSNNTLQFYYCNSSNLLMSDIKLYLEPNNKEKFNFKVVNIASGDCTYFYSINSCLLNFQYFINPLAYQYYYGITYCNNYKTTVDILNMYSAIFTIS